ncbi:AbgT family transporter [Clostridium sp. Sa3CUN1]|uniref:AbgT family transporter n=1 Tax=Clostridium gallinarum TaxID=2762246 RepID=A0ABR8Q876_9CLOT|nr:AbgT family transporter [Clostridium gallinarum]MBD7916575.1 AbgT family transporter [Clostridium gallinarum]
MKSKDKINDSNKGILNSIEKIGNKLPHPATIFVILCGIIIVVSAIMARMGVSVTYTGLDRSSMEIKEMTSTVVSLLTPEGIRYMFTSAVKNFTSFAPLGTVLVALLGVGVAEGTGLIGTLLTKLVTSTPKRLITVVVVFAGVMSSIASDAGYVVLVPLGAIVFLSFGRHPMAGLAAAFAGVSGGYSANLLAGPTDALLAGISTEGAKLFSADAFVGTADNWYFIIVSTFLITIIGTLVTEKIVEPKLGQYKGDEKATITQITSEQKRGLKFASISALIFIIIMLISLLPNGVLRNPQTNEILNSPFMDSIVIIIALLFFIPGVAYGIGCKTIKSDKDVINLMGKSMSTMGGYIVLVFFAAQFVQYFSYTNIGIVIAVNGANFLEGIGFTGIPLIVSFVILTAFINLFMGSASAKWAIMAPVFIPMLMNLGTSPALVQMAYRIGDSSTNIISPLMSYFALIVAFAEKYDKKSGVGTLITTMIPYSIAFLIGWTVLLIIWYMFGLPLGPGVGVTI